MESGCKSRDRVCLIMALQPSWLGAAQWLYDPTAFDIADQLQKEGVKNLRLSGLIKVKQGVTSLEEVEAITNE